MRTLYFHGEKPTDEEGPYKGLFNEGNAWLVRAFLPREGGTATCSSRCRAVMPRYAPVS